MKRDELQAIADKAEKRQQMRCRILLLRQHSCLSSGSGRLKRSSRRLLRPIN
jgi:hypothetical protein